MRQTTLMVMLVMLGMPVAAIGRPMNIPSETTAPSRVLVPNVSNLRLLICGGTAQWAFQFMCVGAHCRFQHMHVPHHLRQAQTLNLAVRFSGTPHEESIAAMWLRRVSGKRESAGRN